MLETPSFAGKGAPGHSRRALARSHADAALSVLAVRAEVRTIPCGAVHAVAAGEGGARAKVVSLAPARVLVAGRSSVDAGRCRRECAVPNFWYF